MAARGRKGRRSPKHHPRRNHHQPRTFAEPLERRVMLAVQELVLNGSFDSGVSPWTTTGDFWAGSGTGFNGYRSPSGYAAGGVSAAGVAKNFANGSITSGSFSVPSNAASASLTFYVNISSNETTSTQQFDTLNVNIVRQDGSLEGVALFSNLDEFSFGSYQPVVINLISGTRDYRGQNVRVRFLGASNASNTTTFRIDDVSVTANIPAPAITSISPNSGSTAGGNTVTIEGTNLQFASSVTFGGTAASFGYNTSTGKLQATAPARAASAVNVSVTTPGGTATSNNGYTYVAPQPTISVTSPNGGEGWQVGASQTVSWSVSGDTSSIYGFLYYLSTNNGSSYTGIGGTAFSSTRSFSYTPTTAQATAAARIKIEAIDSNSNVIGSDTSNDSFTISNLAPTVSVASPGVSATWQVGTSQTISWSVSGSTSSIYGYSVYLSTNNGGSYTHIRAVAGASATSTTYTPTSSQVTNDAMVLVRAIDSNAAVVAEDATNGTFRIVNADPVQIPPAPSPMSPGFDTLPGQTIATATPTMQWAAMSNVDGFGVYVSRRQADGTYSLVFSSRANGLNIAGTATTFQLPPGYLDEGGEFRWNLNAYNAAGWGTHSARLYFTYSTAAPPGTPAGLNATATGSTSINLAWNSVAGATAYRLYRSTSGSGPWTNLVYSGSARQWTDSGVQPNTTYYYVVSATGAGGESPASAPTSAHASALAVPPPPSNVSAQVLTSKAVRVSWTITTAGASYIVKRSLSATGTYSTIGTADAGATGFTDDGPVSSPSATYYYRVLAEAGSVRSLPSSPASATVTQASQQTPVPTAPTPATTPVSTGAMKVYNYDFVYDSWVLVSNLAEPSGLEPNFWEQDTILLTHGWNAGFAPSGDDYIHDFARHFASSYKSWEYNLLAVDWSFASDPNHEPAWWKDILKDGLKDARDSANYGIAAGEILGERLASTDAQPGTLALIGHSNGAGFMAGLAKRLKFKTGQRVKQLTALDAPAQTASYTAVLQAESAVQHIENYYLPVIQSSLETGTLTGLLLTGGQLTLNLPAGFGLPILNRSNITNYELNSSYGTPTNGHVDVPHRFAETAGNFRSGNYGHPWGFFKSAYMNGGITEHPNGGLWTEKSRGDFEEVPFVAKQALFLEQKAQSWAVGTLATAAQVIPEGEDIVFFLAALPDGTAKVYQFGRDGAVTIKTKAIDATTTVVHAFAEAAVSVWQYTSSGLVAGKNVVVETVSDAAGNVWRFIRPVLPGARGNQESLAAGTGAALDTPAGSPYDIHASFPVEVPAGAQMLVFDLSVANPGNDDVMDIAVNGAVLGQLALGAQPVENSTISLPFGDYAGQSVNLSFIVASAVPTAADFLIGNIRLAAGTKVAVPPPLPGRIEAEGFDVSGPESGYRDLDSVNQGGAYRPEGVDISATSDPEGGGFNVGWTSAGEWLAYTVTIPVGGAYDLRTRLAAPAAGGAFYFELNGLPITAVLPVPDTGGWNAWSTLVTAGVTLPPGEHLLRVRFDAASSDGFIANFNWFEFTLRAPDPPPTVDIVDVTPDPRTGAVAGIDFVFSEAVTGFGKSDLTLTRDGVAVDLDFATLNAHSGAHYTLGNLAALTGRSGSYLLTLNPSYAGIGDSDGNLLETGASESWTVNAPPGNVVEGFVFTDRDGDGAYGFHEPALPGVTVWIDSDKDGVRDAGEPSTVSGTDGSYRFGGLADGTHHVRQVLPADHVRTSAAVLTPTLPGAGNFTIIDGTWGVSGGAFQITAPATASTAHLNNRAVHTRSISGDFDLRVDATSPAPQPGVWNGLAVIFGYQSPGNYYFFSSNQNNDAGTSGIFRVLNGQSVELADIPAMIVPGTTYQLRLVREGSVIRAFRNGVLLASAADSTFATGGIGFGANGNRAIFDNLSVVTPQGQTLISEAFNNDGAWAQNFGNFPLRFDGSGGDDAFDLELIGGWPGQLQVVETLAGQPPVTYTIEQTKLGGNAVTVSGGGGDDRIAMNHVDLLPAVVAIGGSGQDEIYARTGYAIYAGAGTLGNQSYSGFETLTISANWAWVTEDLNGINLNFSATEAYVQVPQHLNRLRLTANSQVRLDATVSCTDLRVESGTLRLGSHALLVDYAGDSPLGAWDGSTYTGISGHIRTGLWGVPWDAGRIMGPPPWSASPAGDAAAMVGAAEASRVLGLNGTQTALWNGHVVDATSVLIKYTYAGDADLNGRIDGDDYFVIDSHIGAAAGTPGAWGWWNGDFDYSGKINGDDYWLIDSNIGRQGVVL